MKASGQHRFWGTTIKVLILAVTMTPAVIFMSPGGLQAAPPSAEHQAIQNQITTHDGAQTTQHNALSQQIATGADHSGLSPAWDKTLPANNPGGACPSNSSRFTCVMGGAAVRDNETGLVWEQSPDGSTRTWFAAITHCAQRQVGGRKGWHLPLIEQLASLVDSSNTNPALPTGHPFTSVQSAHYWSATTLAENPTDAWPVNFSNVSLGILFKTFNFHAWCVRGGQSFDGNTHNTLH